jgi:hypothetical protein
MRLVISSALLLSALALASCQGGKQSAAGAAQPEVLTPGKGPVFPGEWPADETLLISLQRTPCMGRCPVYKLSVYSDGTLRYEGAQFTDRLGTYYGVIELSRVQPVLDFANKIGFRNLAQEYPSGENRIMDLPSANLFIRGEGWEKTIANRNHANPRAEGEDRIVLQLQELAVQIDGLLEGMDMIQVGEGRQD